MKITALGVNNEKPLSAIAAARLRAEVAAKSAAIQETTLEPLPAPSSPPPENLVSEYEDSDAEPEPVVIKRNLKLCNWRNDPKDILSDTDSELTINLEKHTTIALIGYFTFKVLRGAININGANVGAVTHEGQKAVTHHAAVPATHAISKIRGLDGRNQVQFMSCREPAPFSNLNPLFTDIWNAKTRNQKPRTFSVVSRFLLLLENRYGNLQVYRIRVDLQNCSNVLRVSHALNTYHYPLYR
jgi:polynucleotide 5'-hydroxyl-kinase GRC3/NOL9